MMLARGKFPLAEDERGQRIRPRSGDVQPVASEEEAARRDVVWAATECLASALEAHPATPCHLGAHVGQQGR